MSSVLIVWLCFCGLATVVWLMRHRDITRAVVDHSVLTPSSHATIDGEDAPRLSVMVAAKDEEPVIETCVRSLLDQDYPNYQVVAANDRSNDRTGEILDKLAAEHPDRLSVVHVEHLRPGWFGKNNAMRLAVAEADGVWFCFVDADCRQVSQRTLSVAVQEARHRGADLLSVLPELETQSFWERVIQPVCGAIMAFWFNPRRVNDPASDVAYANGAFMLMSRDHYHAIGGHDAVRTQLNEDIHMARLTKSLGRRLFVIQNRDLYMTRMYASCAESWRGWSRIFYGTFGTWRRLLITFGVLAVMSVLPFVGGIASAIGWIATGGDATWGWALLASLCAIVMLESVIIRFMRLVRSRWWAWMTYPVGAVLALGMLLSSMTRLLGVRTTWRGTTYRKDQTVATVESDRPTASDVAVREKPSSATADVA